MAELFEFHMTQSDLFAWNMERDPLLRSTIVAVATMDRSPDWDRLVEMMDRASRLVPSFRTKVVPAPLGMAPPRLVVDPDFDLSWHVRRMRVPSPGTLDAVLDVARTAGMQAFDKDRPLWQFTLLEGLEGDCAALVMKIHHSLTDGIGGMQIADEIVDFERGGTDRGPMPDPPVPENVGALGSIGDAVAWNWNLGRELTRQVASTPVPLAVRAITHPLDTARDAVRLVGSVAKFVRPVTETRSPVMTERRLGWHYAVLDVPLDPLHAAGHHGKATLNDAFLAGVLIGLRRYHERHGATASELRVTMPISLRTEEDDPGGNKITLVRFPLPLDIDDPVELMRAVDDRVAEWRDEPAVPFSGVIAGALNLLPSSVLGGMLKHVDFLASNVPGSPVPLYVAGAKVQRYYAFGPTIGAAVNVTLMSYGDTCCIGINTDTGAVPDLDVLTACLADGFRTVLDVDLGGEVVNPLSG